MINIENLKYMSLPIQYEIDPLFDDERFLKLRARIQHDSKNLNGSTFTKEDMERARHSIANIPVLANVIYDETTGMPKFGSHDIILEKDKLNEGQYREIYKETPIGLINETPNYNIVEYDGRNHVVCDVWIWRGYSNYAEQLIERDENVSLSMEISVDKFSFDSKTNTYSIIDYKYTGITLLGEEFTPAMENARVTTKPDDTFNGKDSLLFIMKELKNALQNYNSSNIDVDINSDFCNKIEGGNNKLDEKLELLKQFSLDVKDLDFEIENLSIEDFTLKLNEFNKKQLENKFSITNTFAITYKQKREALQKTLSPIYESDGNGNIIAETNFYIEDFSDDFVFVERARYTELDYSYDIGRFAYNFDQANFKATITSEFEKMIKTYLTVDDYNKYQSDMNLLKYTEDDMAKIKSEFDTYKSEYTTKDTEVQEFEALKEYKAQKELEEFNEIKESLFSQFEDLNGVSEFEALKIDTKDFTLDDIEKELFFMRGKKLTSNFTAPKKKAKTEQKAQFTKIPMMESGDNADNPYGNLFDVYGNRK